MTLKTQKIDLESPTLVESIIKRKNGTQVPFGHAAHRQTVYNFQPIDPTSKDSPHVCDVPNDIHRDQLLDIKEGFRLYNEPKSEFDDENNHQNDDDDDDIIDYNDMLGFDAEQVTTDFLKKYAKDHLKISSTSKAIAQEYAKSNYDLDLDGTMTVINMLREIMKAEQAIQLVESEAAKLANK